jgi:hypothetical protein
MAHTDMTGRFGLLLRHQATLPGVPTKVSAGAELLGLPED